MTGANNSGDGATTDRPVINGVVVGRNTGRGRPIYDFSPFIERPFVLFNERVRVIPRMEAFNVFQPRQLCGLQRNLGQRGHAGRRFRRPTAGITAQLPARSLQFSLKIAF